MAEPKLAEHVEQTVHAVAELHAAHRSHATALDRAADRLTSTLGQSLSVLLLTLAMAGWIVFNIATERTVDRAIDPPPFTLLEVTATLAALLLAVLILATQRRNEILAEARAQLTLQLAMLSEQKAAKIIALLEELRRDLPSVPNRTDELSDAMTEAPDPKTVLDAINAKSGTTQVEG